MVRTRIAAGKFVLVPLAAFLVAAAASSIASAQQTIGLQRNDPSAFRGYTLINKDNARLFDNDGLQVHHWVNNLGGAAYVLENGNLLTTSRGFREQTWDGVIVWDYSYDSQHHDGIKLPNGNVLLITRETILYDDAIAAGRDPALIGATPDDIVRPVHLIEVEQTGLNTGQIVWEWRVWDHLVQDFDNTKANFGVVSDQPELINLNHRELVSSNLVHCNGLDYNPVLDQIVVSARRYNEIWIIDHSTTTAEAAGHTGGNGGMGGDILYRWGNTDAYDRGVDPSDQTLFGQHNPQWIKPGLPGEGNIVIFNNGNTRPEDHYSTVVEIVPPEDGFGYTLGAAADAVYGPVAPIWTYAADPTSDFYSFFISGVTRLPNGNTLIDEGSKGHLFEVEVDGTIVWEYTNPIESAAVILTQGDTVTVTRAPPDEHWANRLFRAPRYAPNYAGFDGRDLTPGDPIELYNESAALTLQSSHGGTVTIGDGTYSYGVGQLVTIVAEADPGQLFLGWTVESGSASFSDASAEHTTFTMGSVTTTVRANFGQPVPALSMQSLLLLAALLTGITFLTVRRWEA